MLARMAQSRGHTFAIGSNLCALPCRSEVELAKTAGTLAGQRRAKELDLHDHPEANREESAP